MRALQVLCSYDCLIYVHVLRTHHIRARCFRLHRCKYIIACWFHCIHICCAGALLNLITSSYVVQVRCLMDYCEGLLRRAPAASSRCVAMIWFGLRALYIFTINLCLCTVLVRRGKKNAANKRSCWTLSNAFFKSRLAIHRGRFHSSVFDLILSATSRASSIRTLDESHIGRNADENPAGEVCCTEYEKGSYRR